jgi:hypothetical protein
MDSTQPLQPCLRWPEEVAPAPGDWIEWDGRRVPIHYRRNALARRYRLFVDREGRPRVTIPRRGSRREAQRFLDGHREWLVRQLRRFVARQAQVTGWRPGTEILFRGSPARLELNESESPTCLRLGAERIPLPGGPPEPDRDLREIVERHFRRLAELELPARVRELAALHQSPVRRVTIRNQRTRWGSCSRRGTISLNWRLVQVPVEVRDYIILHELMHLREMNHSRRFWALVAQACPDYKIAEAWLRSHSTLLL